MAQYAYDNKRDGMSDRLHFQIASAPVADGDNQRHSAGLRLPLEAGAASQT